MSIQVINGYRFINRQGPLKNGNLFRDPSRYGVFIGVYPPVGPPSAVVATLWNNNSAPNGRFYYWDCQTYENAIVQANFLTNTQFYGPRRISGAEYFNSVFCRLYACTFIFDNP